MSETPENKTDNLLDELKNLATELADLPPLQVGIGEVDHKCIVASFNQHEDGTPLSDKEIETHSHYIVGIKFPENKGDLILALIHDMDVATAFGSFLSNHLGSLSSALNALADGPSASNPNGN